MPEIRNRLFWARLYDFFNLEDFSGVWVSFLMALESPLPNRCPLNLQVNVVLKKLETLVETAQALTAA